MARLIEDPEKLNELACSIQALADGFDTEVKILDDGWSSGLCATELRHTAKALQETQEALKQLMLKTVSFLEEKGARITETDLAYARELLKNDQFYQ